MLYSDLNIEEKNFFNYIENGLIKHNLNLKSFIKVLGILINKHKGVIKK